MVDIKKVSELQQQDIRSEVDDMEFKMIQELRHGNIYDIFAKSRIFKLTDFQNFFANQWKSFKGQVVQDETIKSMESSFYGPNIEQFARHSRAKMLQEQDAKAMGEGLLSSLSSSLKSKSMKIKDAGETEADPDPDADPNTPLTEEERLVMADDVLAEYDAVMNETMNQIMDAQALRDYEAKMNEVKSEVRKIIMLAKQGKIGVEFVLIALARVNTVKSGVIISWMGKKAMRTNEQINKIYESLSSGDANNAGAIMQAQADVRDQTFSLNDFMRSMEQSMQNIASVLEQVHGMIGEINRTRREIISRYAAR